MKLKLSLLFFTFLFTLSNCGNELVDDQRLLSNRLLSIQALDGEPQRLAYQMLEKDEKVTLWTNRLNLSLQRSYNNNQINLINQLKDVISSPVFNNVEDLTKFRNEWLANAIKQFDKKTIFSLAFSINEPKEEPSVNIPAPSPDNVVPDCECNQGSLYSCGGITGDYRYTCDKATCNKQISGCGFLWSYTCDGICKWHMED